MPTLYDPFAAVEVTFDTVGSVLSMRIALLAPREFVAPGEGKVNVAPLPEVSVILETLRGMIANPEVPSAT